MIQSSVNAILIKVAALGLEIKHLGKSICEMQPHLVKIVSHIVSYLISYGVMFLMMSNALMSILSLLRLVSIIVSNNIYFMYMNI